MSKIESREFIRVVSGILKNGGAMTRDQVCEKLADHWPRVKTLEQWKSKLNQTVTALLDGKVKATGWDASKQAKMATKIRSLLIDGRGLGSQDNEPMEDPDDLL